MQLRSSRNPSHGVGLAEYPDVHTEINHLFRKESGIMVSVLTKIFGLEHYDLAQDVVQHSLLSALESWKFHGIPENPKAWLYRVAKNKAIDVIRKKRPECNFDFSDSEHVLLNSEYSLSVTMEKFWDTKNLKDDFLAMMYACCHPELTPINQVAFILKSLCGFSTKEIAKTFLTSEEVISKRLHRTKEYFRGNNIYPKIPSKNELKSKNKTILSCIYLMFNEGYNSTHSEDLIRKDLITQCIRLLDVLLDNPLTKSPEASALMALVLFHSARLDSRISSRGDLVLLAQQNRDDWDTRLITMGMEYLNKSASGEELSVYHIEAAIAYEHCKAKNYSETNWQKIIEYYELLGKVSPSVLIELNKCAAILEYNGAEKAKEELQKISDNKLLDSYYLYHALESEIFVRLGDINNAITHLKKAEKLTQSKLEKKLLNQKLLDLSNQVIN